MAVEGADECPETLLAGDVFESWVGFDQLAKLAADVVAECDLPQNFEEVHDNGKTIF
jgi:hypothetical protein